jgi:hypothetical protein
MNLLYNKPRNADAAEVRARIFNVLPSASYQLEKLFGLLDIEYSDQTETACVECRDTPKLLLNRRFVEEYCADDGDLFLLILHELHHVILGHTRLFPRVDRIDNIAFDAVINSILCRTVGRSVGVRLFTSTNAWEDFPARLLRPPPGWPGAVGAALVNLPEEEARVIRLLYGESDEALTYHDIYHLLRRSFGKHDDSGAFQVQITEEVKAQTLPTAGEGRGSDGERAGSKPGRLDHKIDEALLDASSTEEDDTPAGAGRDLKARLLGSHDGQDAVDPLLTGVIRRIVEGWPPPPLRIAGRDEGRSAEAFQLKHEEKPGAAFTKAFKGLLRRCGIHSGRGPAVYRRELTVTEFVRESVVPDERDRRVTALKAITGRTPLIYRSLDCQIRPRPKRVPVVHLYLDVSGSMSGCLPYLTAACREPFRRGELKVFAFSTVVSEVKGSDLTRATFANTQGTDINALLVHAASTPAKKRPKVILIVTDGYVGPARSHLLSSLAKIRTVVALTGPAYDADLKPWISELNQLPKP